MDQNTLKQRLHYDPLTGVFTRISGRKVGQRVGTLHHSGYVVIHLDGKQYGAHRLAFLYMTGYLPITVDHRNLVKSDNRWDNLREATKSQQQGNTPTKHAGRKGVSFDKNRGVYVARCADKWLGRFPTEAEAYAAYEIAAKAHFEEFARV